MSNRPAKMHGEVNYPRNAEEDDRIWAMHLSGMAPPEICRAVGTKWPKAMRRRIARIGDRKQIEAMRRGRTLEEAT